MWSYFFEFFSDFFKKTIYFCTKVMYYNRCKEDINKLKEVLIMSTKEFEVKVNNMVVETIEDGFKFEQGELLWQALSEQARDLGIEGISDTEENLADWEDLDDSDIESLLKDAKEQGFINDYEIEEI